MVWICQTLSCMAICWSCRLAKLRQLNSELERRLRGKEKEVSCAVSACSHMGHMFLSSSLYSHVPLRSSLSSSSRNIPSAMSPR